MENDFFNSKPEKEERMCDYPGCHEKGEYKAPKDRTLKDYYWFCLKHVEEYNKNWDFFEGLSPEEVEDRIRRDTVWDRPTWRLSDRKNPYETGRESRELPKRVSLSRKDQRLFLEALSVLNLDENVSLEEVKKAYKKLAKKYHPDVNRNNPKAEELFKKITEAYHFLSKILKLS